MPLIRSRDVRVHIHEMGFEKGMVHSLERLLDEMAGWREDIRQLVELTAQCIDGVEKLNQINDGMKRTIDQIRRIRQQEIEQDGDLSG